jgi:hypothetical protein
MKRGVFTAEVAEDAERNTRESRSILVAAVLAWRALVRKEFVGPDDAPVKTGG